MLLSPEHVSAVEQKIEDLDNERTRLIRERPGEMESRRIEIEDLELQIQFFVYRYLAACGPEEPLPFTVWHLLWSALCTVVEGKQHFLCRPSDRGQGDKSYTAAELLLFVPAAKYAEFCRPPRVIKDRAFVNTICRNYGVGPGIVRLWLKNEKVLRDAEFLQRKSQAEDHPELADSVKRNMELYGAIYRYQHDR